MLFYLSFNATVGLPTNKQAAEMVSRGRYGMISQSSFSYTLQAVCTCTLSLLFTNIIFIILIFLPFKFHLVAF